MKPRRTIPGPVRQKACMACGRNEHKVAIRERIMERNPSGALDPYWTPTGRTEIRGYCPSCTPTVVLAGTLVYDRRGERTKKANPIIETHPVPTVPAVVKNITAPTIIGQHGRRKWKQCLHPAELDANGDCYTCHGSVWPRGQNKP